MNQAQLSRLLTFSLEIHQHVARLSNRDQVEHNLNEFGEVVLKSLFSVLDADALAILLFDQGKLSPIAVHGLLPECLGRRFLISEHPRLETILNADHVVRFDHESTLPDPYDGLLLASHGDIPVHACMGIALKQQDKVLGVVTFDSLDPSAFEHYPDSMLDMINATISNALSTVLNHVQLATSAKHQSAVVHAMTQASHAIIGEHPLMQKLKQEIRLVASSDLSVLITGETGTGKELVARHIHQQSNRADNPYVQVNCASLPEGLAESEFFGHRKGAFTGADKHREGKFLLADGGTIFLDEIGELPLSLQSKLLRVLQSGEIQPVGADDTHVVNVRIVAATNRDLQQEVAEGRFRADLYHRLSVYPIQVPPLRTRMSDVTLLCGFFLEQLRKKLNVEQLVITSPLMSRLESYDWPGNVRELEHILSRTALKAKHDEWQSRMVKLLPAHCELGTHSDSTTTLTPTQTNLPLKSATDDFQRALITSTLTQAAFNWAQAARLLDVDRANLVRLAKRLNISVKKSL
ncbi:nitric oxide reductase transcriptional regulator NorR [Pseudoalteromonas xiamenensis]